MRPRDVVGVDRELATGVLWPSRPATTWTRTPSARASVADAWRRSWRRVTGRPAAFAAALNRHVSVSDLIRAPERSVAPRLERRTHVARIKHGSTRQTRLKSTCNLLLRITAQTQVPFARDHMSIDASAVCKRYRQAHEICPMASENE